MRPFTNLIGVLLTLTCLSKSCFASYQNLLHEALLRQEVYLAAKNSCGHVWGSQIERLKQNLKVDLANGSKHTSRSEKQSALPRPEEINAITSHLCKTGEFRKNVRDLVQKYRNGELSSSFLSDAAGKLDLSDEDTDYSTSTSMSDTEESGDFSMKENKQELLILTPHTFTALVAGLVIGVLLALYFMKTTSTTNTLSTKIRRPEL